MKNRLLTILSFLILVTTTWADSPLVTENLDTMIIQYLSSAKGKLPVIFLAHNGYGHTSDWGDFPAELAGLGYFVVNIGWTSFPASDDIVGSVNDVVKQYDAKIDIQRAAFIGGCHGGVKMIAALNSELPVRLKAIVLLSMSEYTTPPIDHPPILGIYSLRDHLGKGYVNTQKNLYANIIQEPKKVIALDATAHGTELTIAPDTQVRVRSEIRDWLNGLL